MKGALKLALEALENISTALREDDVLGSDIEMLLNAAAAVRVALAQRESNFCSRCGKRLASGFVEISIHTCTPPQPEQEPKTYALLYPQADYVATPDERPWVGLTVDELIDLERKHLSHENLTQAIEAKLKKKNT